jgi:hypothetical protein
MMKVIEFIGLIGDNSALIEDKIDSAPQIFNTHMTHVKLLDVHWSDKTQSC